jgi:hypothetical protein
MRRRGRTSRSKPTSELVNPKIKEHRGRIVKNIRDGLPAEFARVNKSREWSFR